MEEAELLDESQPPDDSMPLPLDGKLPFEETEPPDDRLPDAPLLADISDELAPLAPELESPDELPDLLLLTSDEPDNDPDCESDSEPDSEPDDFDADDSLTDENDLLEPHKLLMAAIDYCLSLPGYALLINASFASNCSWVRLGKRLPWNPLRMPVKRSTRRSVCRRFCLAKRIIISLP